MLNPCRKSSCATLAGLAIILAILGGCRTIHYHEFTGEAYMGDDTHRTETRPLHAIRYFREVKGGPAAAGCEQLRRGVEQRVQ